MGHELDITEGVASFANSRSDAWHRLGQSVGHTMTAFEALRAAHLADWAVRKMPLQVPMDPILTDDGVTTPPPLVVPEHFATVRNNPITGELEVLGVVGRYYEPMQNEVSCELLDALVDESGAHFETAGALRGGRETFITMKLPKTMTFDGRDGSKDRTDFYLAALNSHDGTSKFRFLVTPVRIVCANTQGAAILRAKASYSISHTGSASSYIAEARTHLRLGWQYVDEYEAEAAALYAKEMDTVEMRRFVRELLDVDKAETPVVKRHREERADSIVKLWVSSPTVAPIGGTRWGAYNAVTEYLDHVIAVPGKHTADEERAIRAMRSVNATSSSNAVKAKAFSLLQSM